MDRTAIECPLSCSIGILTSIIIMFSSQQAEISLNVPVRSMDAVRGDRMESRFLVGSCSTENKNHLHLVRFQSELNQLTHEALLEHSGAVSKLTTSPTDASMLLTVAEQSTKATLWKIPSDILEQPISRRYGGDDDDEDDDYPAAKTAALEERASLNSSSDAMIVDIQWRSSGAAGDDDDDHASSSPNGDVLTLDAKGNLQRWDVAYGGAAAESSTRHMMADVSQSSWSLPPRMAWDPHHEDAIAVAAGTSVQLVDWRTDTSVPAGTVQRFTCHRHGVTDLDYNPNKPHVLVTAGQEGLIKFWDLRSAKQPLLTIRGGHSHWATKVVYNPFHDQLVVSAGTDSVVNLWRISTISSAPLFTLDDEDENHNPAFNNMAENHATDTTNEGGPNVRVSRLEHMESVYTAAWGAADAWIYASAGYDGKVVLNHVPSKEKYKILL